MDAWGATVNNDDHNDTHQDNRKEKGTHPRATALIGLADR
jgi:hypothetical protein